MILSSILFGIIGIIVGTFIGYYIRSVAINNNQRKNKQIDSKTIKSAEQSAENIIRSAEIKAKLEVVKAKETFEKSLKEQKKAIVEERSSLSKRETILVQREGNLDKKAEMLEHKEQNLDKKINENIQLKQQLEASQAKAEALTQEATERLQRIARVTRDEARKEIFDSASKEIENDIATLIRRKREEFFDSSKSIARNIILSAMQKFSQSQASETTMRAVSFKGEEIKGRIIGREGRNIRTFESATGVTMVIDDTPDVVILSSFEPERREIAAVALERLIESGRIHPALIEEVVQDVKETFQEHLTSVGANACATRNILITNNDLLNKIGKLKLRTSFFQNVLQHSIEVSSLSATIAAEIGLDPNIASRVGLLHDIGKALDDTIDGAHAAIGAEFLKKCGESDEIVLGVAGHHFEIDEISDYAVIASIADSISCSRPGARRENTEIHISRIQNIEKIAKSFRKVRNVFAVQAGRNVRVIVDPTETTDEEASILAKNIADLVAKEITFSGEICITVIREKRCIAYAK